MSLAKPTVADLRAFVTVGQLQSFAAAAQVLHLSQPALSRRIEKLEGALGVRLFHRTTRKLSLTPEGEVFHGRCRELLGGVDEAGLAGQVAAVTALAWLAMLSHNCCVHATTHIPFGGQLHVARVCGFD